MSNSVEDKRAIFRELHERGSFMLATPRNEVGLRHIERLGARAIETTIRGFSGWTDHADYRLCGEKSLPHLARVCAATDLPVSADLHNALDADMQASVETVRAAISTGVAGLSMTDCRDNKPCSPELFMERIQVAREIIVEAGQDIVVQARCEGIQAGTIKRNAVLYQLHAYAKAGAEVVCIPGVEDPSLIKAIVDAVAPKVVSMIIRDWTTDVKSICNLGARRIGVGFALGGNHWTGFQCGYASVLSQAIESSFELLH